METKISVKPRSPWHYHFTHRMAVTTAIRYTLIYNMILYNESVPTQDDQLSQSTINKSRRICGLYVTGKHKHQFGLI